MATDKRERQRENRAAKRAADSKVERKQKTLNMAKRVGIWLVVGGVLLVLANIVWGG